MKLCRRHFQLHFLEWKLLIKIPLKFVPICPIDNIQALVQIMACAGLATSHYLKQWWPSLLRHICITRPQWVNTLAPRRFGCTFKYVIYAQKHFCISYIGNFQRNCHRLNIKVSHRWQAITTNNTDWIPWPHIMSPVTNGLTLCTQHCVLATYWWICWNEMMPHCKYVSFAPKKSIPAHLDTSVLSKNLVNNSQFLS